MDKGRGDSQKMPGLTASVCQNGSVALSGAACPGRSGTPALTLPRISSMTTARAFRGFRFPAEVILWAVRWYLQFPISYRDGTVNLGGAWRADLGRVGKGPSQSWGSGGHPGAVFRAEEASMAQTV